MKPNRKQYQFIGSDPRFIRHQKYDVWQIAELSNQSFHSIKNRLIGTDCFCDMAIRFKSRNNSRPQQGLTSMELFSAKWLKEKLL